MSGGEIFPLEVYLGQDFYVPAFRVLVGGRTLGAEMHDIQSVTFTDSLTEIDSCDLTVNNWDTEQRKFKYSDGDTFNPWKEIQIFMGYHHHGRFDNRLMLTGDITTMTPNFPSSGGPTLTVRALNILHRFRIKQETDSFPGKTDSYIAEKLVDKINEQVKKTLLKIQVRLDPEDIERNKPDETPIPSLALDNQYPIMFLLERARRIGYELTVEEAPANSGAVGSEERVVTIHFRSPKNVVRPTYVLEWGKTLISFQPTLQTARQVSEVTVRGWDPKAKDVFSETATRADLRDEKIVNPDKLRLLEPEHAQKKEIVVDRPIQTKDEAKELAKKTLRQIAQGLVEGKGKTIGLPDLRTGVKLQIKGLGERFSGTEAQPFSYFVTGTTHSIGEGGYTTDFTARMEMP